MEITCAKHQFVVADADLSGSRFKNVNRAGADLDDVNMSGWRVHNANLAGLRITAATLAGARMHHVNLTGLAITECHLEGVTIDGIPVLDMIAAYNARAANATEPTP